MAKSNPQKVINGTRREDRRLARDVRNDAAAGMGMRRFEFMLLVANGDEDAIEELKLSLMEHDDSLMFDEEKFNRILDMIIAFITALMQIFSMFGGM